MTIIGMSGEFYVNSRIVGGRKLGVTFNTGSSMLSGTVTELTGELYDYMVTITVEQEWNGTKLCNIKQELTGESISVTLNRQGLIG